LEEILKKFSKNKKDGECKEHTFKKNGGWWSEIEILEKKTWEKDEELKGIIIFFKLKKVE